MSRNKHGVTCHQCCHIEKKCIAKFSENLKIAKFCKDPKISNSENQGEALESTVWQSLACKNYGIKTIATWTTAKRAIANGQLPTRVYQTDLSRDELITEAVHNRQKGILQ